MTTTFTNQYLQVELIVRKDDIKDFETSVVAFLNRGGFNTIDPESNKHLVLAIRTPKPIEYTGYRRRQSEVLGVDDEFAAPLKGKKLPKAQFYRYVHVWRLGQITDLDITRLMRLSADDDDYRHIDSLVVRETQDIVFGVPWLSLASAGVMKQRLDVVRVTRQLMTSDLGTYLFSAGAWIPTLSSKGFKTLGFFQNVTGLLNTVTEYWHTTKKDLSPISQSPSRITSDVFKGKLPLSSPVPSAPATKTAFISERFVSYLTSPDRARFRRV